MEAATVARMPARSWQTNDRPNRQFDISTSHRAVSSTAYIDSITGEGEDKATSPVTFEWSGSRDAVEPQTDAWSGRGVGDGSSKLAALAQMLLNLSTR
jgi:hypothetical protein